MKVGEVNKFGILVLETGYGRWYWDVALFEAAVYVPRGARDNDPDHSIGIYRADTQRLDFVLRKVVEYMTRVGLEVFYPPEILHYTAGFNNMDEDEDFTAAWVQLLTQLRRSPMTERIH